VPNGNAQLAALVAVATRFWRAVAHRSAQASILLRRRSMPFPPSTAPRARDRQQIRRDLERLGVGAELRDALCRRLEAIAATLSDDGYQAALAGIAAANEVHCVGEAALERSMGDLREIQRLLGAFSDEMRKLDEALRVLSTYVQRMRTKTSAPARPRTVH
jgi:hypothetical protein